MDIPSGGEEVGQQLRPLDVLTEDLGSFPSTHTTAYNFTQVPGV